MVQFQGGEPTIHPEIVPVPLSRRGLLERTRRQPGCVLAVSSEARDYSERIAFRALDAFQYGDLAGLRADVIEQKQVSIQPSFRVPNPTASRSNSRSRSASVRVAKYASVAA